MNNQRKNAFTVFMMIAATLLAKLLGMFRGVFLAASYGTDIQAEAFAAASKIPLTFFDLLLGAAILGCFIPAYNSFNQSRTKQANRFACTFLNIVILLTGIMSLLGMLFSDSLLAVLSPKLNPQSAALASKLLKIMFPMITFTGAAYVLVGVLQSKGSFIVPSLISAVSNGAIIVYFLFFDQKFGIEGLAVAYIIAWFLQLAVLVYPLCKTDFRYRLCIDLKMPETKKALKTVFPIMAGSWLSPATVLIGTYFSPFTKEAAPLAAFDYANNLFIIIAGIITYGLCNFIFPSLSRLSSQGSAKEYAKAVKDGLSAMLLIIVPVCAGVIALNKQLVCLVYMRGNFSAQSAVSTSNAFLGFSIGIVGYSLIEILNRVFYSKGKTSAPVVAAVIGIAVNIISCITLSLIFPHSTIPSLVYISGAASLGLCAASAYLLFKCKKEIDGVVDRAFLINCLKILTSGLLSFGIMYGLACLTDTHFSLQSFVSNFLTCAVVFVCGTAVFLAFCFVFKVSQCKDILKILNISSKKKKEGD